MATDYFFSYVPGSNFLMRQNLGRYYYFQTNFQGTASFRNEYSEDHLDAEGKWGRAAKPWQHSRHL